MCKRRSPGEWVQVVPCAGFLAGGPRIAQIDPHETDEYIATCLLNCGDAECREWVNLWTPNDGCLYHVAECQMKDVPSDFEPPKDWNPPNIYTKED